MTDNQEKSSLRKIPNVGSQTEQDLIAMGYTSIASLKGKKAEDFTRKNAVCVSVR